jgi:hypothetical protein
VAVIRSEIERDRLRPDPPLWEESLPLKSRQKLEVAESFIQTYLAARKGLTTLGILRSERTLQGDFAEWIVAELFDLSLAPDRVQKDYDAKDRQGRKVPNKVSNGTCSDRTDIIRFPK